MKKKNHVTISSTLRLAFIATFDNDGCLWSEQPMYFLDEFGAKVLRMSKM